MPYSKTKARIDFETKSNELVSLARQISYKKVPLSYAHKNLIFQSTIVLMCTSLEEYLRSFIEDLFFNYKAKSASLTNIPANPRTYALFHKQKVFFENFVYNKDEAKVLEKLSIQNTHLYSVLNDEAIFVNHIDSKILVNDKKYPSPKNLKILFNRIGIKNIFAELNKLGGRNYEFFLRSFLDIRETIAHQESTDLTFDDINRNFRDLMDFLDKLDRVCYSHICKVSGQKFWK